MGTVIFILTGKEAMEDVDPPWCYPSRFAAYLPCSSSFTTISLPLNPHSFAAFFSSTNHARPWHMVVCHDHDHNHQSAGCAIARSWRCLRPRHNNEHDRDTTTSTTIDWPVVQSRGCHGAHDNNTTKAQPLPRVCIWKFKVNNQQPSIHLVIFSFICQNSHIPFLSIHSRLISLIWLSIRLIYQKT